jgi:hypothetical protein
MNLATNRVQHDTKPRHELGHEANVIRIPSTRQWPLHNLD